jgi:hypothetical protein
VFVGIGSNPVDELFLTDHGICFRLGKSSHPRAVRTAEVVRLYAKEARRIARDGRAVIEKQRTDPDAESLGGSNRGECFPNGPQTPERP